MRAGHRHAAAGERRAKKDGHHPHHRRASPRDARLCRPCRRASGRAARSGEVRAARGLCSRTSRDDESCKRSLSGYNPEDFPDGVSPEALGREAWDAINSILANVTAGQNQEGLIAIYQTANGLVSGTLLLGPVGGGQVPFNISTLVDSNLGTLVALVHNHPSGSVQPGPEDYNALNSLTAFTSTGLVSPNLVLYVGVSTQVATPNGSIQGTSLYVFTDNAYNANGVQEGQRVNEDGSSGCRIS